MNRLTLTNFSLKYPIITMMLLFIVTGFFLVQFPKVHFDNDPENMLNKEEPVRVFHHKIKKLYGLYDFVIVGIVNDKNPNGIFNPDTLKKVDTLTKQLLSLKKDKDGNIEVIADADGDTWRKLDMTPDSGFLRAMNKVFMRDPNHLFEEDDSSSIINDELISPSVVDNIKQSGLGSLKMEYLMENVPTNETEALVIRDDAMNNPLYKGTLVSEDGKAINIYIPIKEKTFSYNVATLVSTLTKDWNGNNKIYITGLPVAEDTFGVEMLVQMAISAPLAMLILFLVMYFFFRRVSLIIAPLLLSIITVIWTMGLLIGRGYNVHIMSSMIPIFIMPITVCNSIHVLSEFFDSYHRYDNKDKALQSVIRELFKPMLYATLTTIAGFASLATAPIPPVQIFGLHVAFGVAAGWLLTMMFVPAFIKLFIPEKALVHLPIHDETISISDKSLLTRFLHGLGVFTYKRPKLIVWTSIVIMVFSVYGITLIRVNDNPIKWFGKNHDIRIADKVLNEHFGGTYTAYLTFQAEKNGGMNIAGQESVIRDKVEAKFGKVLPESTELFVNKLNQLVQDKSLGENKVFGELLKVAKGIDKKSVLPWEQFADEVNYLDPDRLTYTVLQEKVSAMKDVPVPLKEKLLAGLKGSESLSGDKLLDKALAVCDGYSSASFKEFVLDMQTELTAPAFKNPIVLRWLKKLQENLNHMGKVGKTSSTVDALEKAQYELQYVEAPADAAVKDAAKIKVANDANFSVPKSAAAAGQVYIQLEGMKKKNTLFHLVTRDFQGGNIWVQLTSGDNRDMSAVVAAVDKYMADNPPPVKLDMGWAGLTYINVIWQEKMVNGMFFSLGSSWIVVLIMMLILFRSVLFGLLAMIPLTVTITFIYGLIGWVGKDYDMPVAILSAMTLGLSVDFAIHFLERSREAYKRHGNWQNAATEMFDEPARAISRNAIVIALGFMPLMLAPLIPYRTVGFFLSMIMVISWLATLLILPTLIKILENKLFKKKYSVD
ncbi:efflux RND transporter permease subunit [Desulfobacula sp.]